MVAVGRSDMVFRSAMHNLGALVSFNNNDYRYSYDFTRLSDLRNTYSQIYA